MSKWTFQGFLIPTRSTFRLHPFNGLRHRFEFKSPSLRLHNSNPSSRCGYPVGKRNLTTVIGQGELPQGLLAKEPDLDGVDRWCRKGIAARDKKNFEEAFDALSKAIELSNGTSPRAFGLRADLLQTQGKYDLAVQDYNTVIALVPTHVPTFNAIASCYKNMRNYEKAAIYFEQTISMAPEFTPALLGHAECYSLQNQHLEAIPLYRKVLERSDPSIPRSTILLALAECLLLTSPTLEATNMFQEALQCDPSNADAWAGFGVGNYVLERYAESAVAFTRALELLNGGCRDDILAKRAASFLHLGKYTEAIKDCNEALHHMPGSLKALLIRGQCYGAVNCHSAAISDLSSFLQNSTLVESSIEENPEILAAHWAQLAGIHARRAMCRLSLYIEMQHSSTSISDRNLVQGETQKYSTAEYLPPLSLVLNSALNSISQSHNMSGLEYRGNTPGQLGNSESPHSPVDINIDGIKVPSNRRDLLDLYVEVDKVLSFGSHPELRLAFDDLVEARKLNATEPTLAVGVAYINAILEYLYKNRSM